jgi:hypothetical protein
MTLTITPTPQTEQRLRERATLAGQTPEGFVRQLLEQELRTNCTGAEACPGSLDAALAPVREEVERSGMSEVELTDFLTEVRDEVRRERRTEKP